MVQHFEVREICIIQQLCGRVQGSVIWVDPSSVGAEAPSPGVPLGAMLHTVQATLVETLWVQEVAQGDTVGKEFLLYIPLMQDLVL